MKNLKHSPWWLSYKESTCNVGDLGSIPGLGRAPGEGNGYLLQYSGLKNSMDCIVLGAKSQTRLSDFHRAYHAPVQNLPLTPISRIKSKDLVMAIEVLCILVPTPALTSISTLLHLTHCIHLQALLLLVQIPEKAISPQKPPGQISRFVLDIAQMSFDLPIKSQPHFSHTVCDSCPIL